MSILRTLRRPLRYRYFNATIGLIALNVIMFLITLTARRTTGYVALVPILVVQHGWWWQIISYMFVHGGWAHLFFNMLALFMFGIQLEQKMGSSEYLAYYLFSGVGAGLATLLVNYNTGMAMVPVVGASGAIFGLLLAFAAFFPDARIFVLGILPIRAPVAVLVFAGIEVFFMLFNMRSGVAHLTHLAGLLFGWVYLLVRLGVNPISAFFRR
jgi:membrane associated rhomboid family serine protease